MCMHGIQLHSLGRAYVSKRHCCWNFFVLLFCIVIPQPKQRVSSADAEPRMHHSYKVIWRRQASLGGSRNYPTIRITFLCWGIQLKLNQSLFPNFINIHFIGRNLAKSSYVTLVSDKGQGIGRVGFLKSQDSYPVK